MFPWPIWGIILNYANDWKLRAVCKKFSILIYGSFKFKYTDLKAIIKRGYANVIVKYFKQHDYEEYNVNSCAINNLGVACELLKKGMFISDTDVLFKTGSLDILKLFNVDLDRITTDAAYNAGKSGSESLVKFILDKKKHVYNSVIISGALRHNHLNIVNLINPNYSFVDFNNIDRLMQMFSMNTLLHEACVVGNLMAVKYLLENWKDVSGEILSHEFRVACKNNRLNVAEYLYHNSVNICLDHQFIDYIASKGYFDVFKFLYEKTTDYYYVKSPIETGRLNIVKFLVSKNVPITEDDVKVACEFSQYHISEYFANLGFKECKHCISFSIHPMKCPIGKKNI